MCESWERVRDFCLRQLRSAWHCVSFPAFVCPSPCFCGRRGGLTAISEFQHVTLSLFDCRAAAEMHTRERAAGWTHTDTHQWFSLRPHDRSALLLLLDSGPPPPVSPVGISPCQVLVLLGCCVVREMPTEGLCASE